MIENKIKEILTKLTNKKISLNQNLISSEIIDSFTLLNLVMELERVFKIKIKLKNIKISNFKNIKLISKLVKKK